MIDKIYIIDLKPEEHFDEVYNKISELGLPDGIPFEIVPAFNGHTEEIPASYSKYANWQLEDTDNKWWSRPLLPGEAGCMISHIRTWYKMCGDDIERALILEEDFKAVEPLNTLDLDSNGEWDIAVLGRIPFRAKDEEVLDQDWVRPLEYYNSHAYILTRKGAEKLLATQIEKNLIPADEFLMACQVEHPRRDIKALFPPCLSSIATKRNFIKQERSIEDSTTEKNQDQPVPEFEILDDSDWNLWIAKYVNPITAKREWDLIVDDLGDNIYEFPLFTERFCKELIALAEAKDVWTENRHDFYPTNDTLLEDLELGRIYSRVLKEFVYPLCIHIWKLDSRGWMEMESENFLARYTPDKQAHLSLHHDFSHITAVVKLNDEFDGGGTWFPKYNKLSNPKRVGTATLHPGMITHLHGARPIYNGRRYITVSFMRKR